MSSFGNQTARAGGRNLTASTNPSQVRKKPGGVTIDWAAVADNNANTTLTSGLVVPSGTKFIPHGTILARITATGKYGPAATGASDGREVVTAAVRGERYVLDVDWVQSDLASEHCGEVFDEGNVFKSRIKMGGTGEPTEANVETMLPGISFITD